MTRHPDTRLVTPGGWTRREWLRVTAAGAVQAVAAGGMLAGARAYRPLGAQLYTVRDQLGDRAPETLKAIAGIGYKEIELGRGDVARLAPIARDLGMSAVSTHIEAPLVTGNWSAWPFLKLPEALKAGKDGLRRALDEVKGHGLQYAVVAFLMPGERGTDAAYFERFADQLNEAGAIGKEAGLTIGYHNHAFEFAPLPDGRLPLDVMVARLDPSLVTLELDVFWVAITGANPVDVIRKYGDRTRLLHLKDKARSAPTVTHENVPREAFVEVGNGTIDFAAVLSAAEATGVKHLIVEQDHTPGDPIASLRQSFDNLAKL